ncbi:uncharacterized protein [Gossypium hirsutum]|uniref:Uncharacterized protein isoform X2 n=1 Tax=Gossypium hirsutum TaxID=3635 RepID=A0ABM2Z393_GOSHI|nr:uncharacterized protein LOC121209784 isoform X2 [Gossypium hirsutum]
MTIDRKFSAKSNIKVSSMRHVLYSIKKASLAIKDYLSKVKSLSDSLTAARSLVTEQEQINVILAGLPIEFESIQFLAFATPMSLELVTEILLDSEARQLALLTDMPLQANLVSQSQQGPDSSSSMTVNYHHLGEAPTSHCSSSHYCNSCPTHSSSHALSSSVATQTWYPDSGATNHITLTVATLNNASPYTGHSDREDSVGGPHA